MCDHQVGKSLDDPMQDKYVRGRALGTGSYGVAWLCHKRADGSQCVIKQMRLGRRRYLSFEEDLQRTRREADCMVRLHHQNVIALYDWWISQHHFYICMEFANDGDLGQRIRAHQQHRTAFSQWHIVVYLAQLLHAVVYLHEQRVLHRDIKPDNCFMSRGDVIKLGDFGLSREADMARTGCGTPYYMAPEVGRGQKRYYSNKCDVWSVGVVLYEMIHMTWPYLPIDGEIRQESFSRRPPWPALRMKLYSAELRRFCERAMTMEPDHRPSSQQLLMDFTRDQCFLEVYNKTCQTPHTNSAPQQQPAAPGRGRSDSTGSAARAPPPAVRDPSPPAQRTQQQQRQPPPPRRDVQAPVYGAPLGERSPLQTPAQRLAGADSPPFRMSPLQRGVSGVRAAQAATPQRGRQPPESPGRAEECPPPPPPRQRRAGSAGSQTTRRSSGGPEQTPSSGWQHDSPGQPGVRRVLLPRLRDTRSPSQPRPPSNAASPGQRRTETPPSAPSRGAAPPSPPARRGLTPPSPKRSAFTTVAMLRQQQQQQQQQAPAESPPQRSPSLQRQTPPESPGQQGGQSPPQQLTPRSAAEGATRRLSGGRMKKSESPLAQRQQRQQSESPLAQRQQQKAEAKVQGDKTPQQPAAATERQPPQRAAPKAWAGPRSTAPRRLPGFDASPGPLPAPAAAERTRRTRNQMHPAVVAVAAGAWSPPQSKRGSRGESAPPPARRRASSLQRGPAATPKAPEQPPPPQQQQQQQQGAGEPPRSVAVHGVVGARGSRSPSATRRAAPLRRDAGPRAEPTGCAAAAVAARAAQAAPPHATGYEDTTALPGTPPASPPTGAAATGAQDAAQQPPAAAASPPAPASSPGSGAGPAAAVQGPLPRLPRLADPAAHLASPQRAAAAPKQQRADSSPPPSTRQPQQLQPNSARSRHSAAALVAALSSAVEHARTLSETSLGGDEDFSISGDESI